MRTISLAFASLSFVTLSACSPSPGFDGLGDNLGGIDDVSLSWDLEYTNQKDALNLSFRASKFGDEFGELPTIKIGKFLRCEEYSESASSLYNMRCFSGNGFSEIRLREDINSSKLYLEERRIDADNTNPAFSILHAYDTHDWDHKSLGKSEYTRSDDESPQ